MITESMRKAEDALHAGGTIRVVPSVLAGREHPELAVEVPLPNLTRLRSREKPPKGHRMMRVATENAGDERFSWDANDFAQINEAKRFFNEMVAKGMVAYRVDPKGRRSGEVIRVFDPHAEEMIFAPVNVPRAVVGG